MNAAIQIAKHLNVSHWQVVRTEEWARVWFTVIKGIGARFVSKKVVKMTAAELNGSTKQVAWAEKIRNGIIEVFPTMFEHNPELTSINECMEFLSSINSAKWWIEHRDIPASVFLAYAYRKLDKLIDGKMPIYYQRQAVKTNGVEDKSLLTPIKFGFAGKNGTPSKALIKGLQCIELHETIVDGQTQAKLVQSNQEAQNRIVLAENSEDGFSTRVTPVKNLIGGGWAARDIEIVVVKIYLENERIGGTNQAYAFERAK